MPNYSYLDSLFDINPTTDDNCQKLADYLALGLNYAIDLHDLGSPVANVPAPFSTPINSRIVYTVDTTTNLKVDGFLKFPQISGYLKIISIPSLTTVEVENVSIDPTILLPLNSPLLSKVIVVRATRSYDAVDIDASSFPMLKVFRQKSVSDKFRILSTDLTISYSMLMPNVAELPGIIRWVELHILAMLSAWGNNDQSCSFQVLPELADRITFEPRIMVGDFQQPVYAYLRISLSAREFN